MRGAFYPQTSQITTDFTARKKNLLTLIKADLITKKHDTALVYPLLS